MGELVSLPRELDSRPIIGIGEISVLWNPDNNVVFAELKQGKHIYEWLIEPTEVRDVIDHPFIHLYKTIGFTAFKELDD